MALTLCDEQDIIDEAGVGANSTITLSSSILTRLGNRAEGEVITATRRDWITGYASINTYVKEMVKEAVVANAAKKIAKYDSSNYINQLEQQTIIDILTDNYKKAIDILNGLDNNSIRDVA